MWENIPNRMPASQPHCNVTGRVSGTLGPRGESVKPNIAIIANVMAPYRLHAHLRIARELHEVTLWSVLTHDKGSQDWAVELLDEIRPVHFGRGESVSSQDSLSGAPREWARGGRIIDWLEKNDIRAVVLNGYNDPGRLRILRWCHSTNLPVMLWTDSNVHSDQVSGAKAALKKLIVGQVMDMCDAYLPCGTLGAKYFQRYGADPARMFFFPVEPDYDLIASLPRDRIEAVRQRFGLDPARKRIITCGRLVHVKRVDLSIDAFAQVAAERPEWDLVIAGGGPLHAELEARVPPALRSRILFTGFMADQADVSALYRLSDLLLIPSDYEPWALVVNEGAAAGLAIISSEVVGAAGELVREGVNGAIFPKGDLVQLVQKLHSATAPERINALRAGSAPVLAEWRERGDPIAGLRNALRAVGVLPQQMAASAAS